MLNNQKGKVKTVPVIEVPDIEIITEGWVLTLDGKFWGETWPADGKCSADMGWTDFQHARIARGPEKPPTKSWFAYKGDPDISRMNKGEWVWFTATKNVTFRQ